MIRRMAYHRAFVLAAAGGLFLSPATASAKELTSRFICKDWSSQGAPDRRVQARYVFEPKARQKFPGQLRRSDRAPHGIFSFHAAKGEGKALLLIVGTSGNYHRFMTRYGTVASFKVPGNIKQLRHGWIQAADLSEYGRMRPLKAGFSCCTGRNLRMTVCPETVAKAPTRDAGAREDLEEDRSPDDGGPPRTMPRSGDDMPKGADTAPPKTGRKPPPDRAKGAEDKRLKEVVPPETKTTKAPTRSPGSIKSIVKSPRTAVPGAGIGKSMTGLINAKAAKERAERKAVTSASRAVPERKPARMCKISHGGKGLTTKLALSVVLPINAIGLPGGLRREAVNAVPYEFDQKANEIWPLKNPRKINIASTVNRVVPFKAVGSVRKVPVETTDKDGKPAEKKVDFLPISIPHLVKAKTGERLDDASGPVINVMVFGGESEIVTSGLDMLQAHMDSYGAAYRLNVVYHRLRKNKTLAAPSRFDGFEHLVRSSVMLSDVQPFVILNPTDFSKHLDDIRRRLTDSPLERIDHVIFVKGPYPLPATAPLEFGKFLDAANDNPKLPRIRGRALNWITVISAKTPGFSNAYLREPLGERVGAGKMYVEEKTDEGRRKFINDPESVGRQMDARFVRNVRARSTESGPGAAAEKTLVLNGFDVFRSTGLILSREALNALYDNTTNLLGSLFLAPADTDTTKMTGADAIERWLDKRKYDNVEALGIIDIIAAGAGFDQLRSKQITPEWLRKPISRMNSVEFGGSGKKPSTGGDGAGDSSGAGDGKGGGTGREKLAARYIAGADEKLRRFHSVMIAAIRELDDVTATKLKCEFVYLPLADSYTTLGFGK